MSTVRGAAARRVRGGRHAGRGGAPTTQQVLRRRRADEALARSYEALRREVLAGVRARLARRGVVLPDADLDAFYNQAWQGLYDQLVAGREVRNPAGFLVVVCERRAVDELRRLHGDRRADGEEAAALGHDEDHAARMDDRARLRQFVEGMRDRLTARECQAAALCYLHDFSRAEAAALLGVEPRRMEKIMDGVSKKVGAFVRAIEAGRWCEERGSLMRAYAYGVLAEEGGRRRLAGEHLAACPGCRAYVRGLRGLSAALPPVALPLRGDGAAEAANALEQLRGWLEAAGAPVVRLVEDAPERAAALAGGAAATGGGAAAAAGGGAAISAGAGGSAAALATGAGGAAGGGLAAKLTAAVVAVALAGGGSAVVAHDSADKGSPRATRAPAAATAAPAAPARRTTAAPQRTDRPFAGFERGTVVRRTAPSRTRTVVRRRPRTAPAAEFVPTPPAPAPARRTVPSAGEFVPTAPAPASVRSRPAAAPPASPVPHRSEFGFEPG